MPQLLPFILLEQHFQLSANKCMYWEEEKALILSDLHLGKTGHFRKAGIAVPQHLLKEDLQQLVTVFQKFKPQQVIVIGDMMHSHANKELDLFLKWRQDFSSLPIQLVMGNHDILSDEWYHAAGIETFKNCMKLGPFNFLHDPDESLMNKTSYNICGHLHPGISIKGLGKQSLRFACFYFAKNYAVLPAFGRFTGTHAIKPKKNETIFAILPKDMSMDQLSSIIQL